MYQREATTFLRSAIENDFAHSLEKLTNMIEVLLSEKALPETYRRFRLALACSNLGSALINLRATSVY
ncbi:MAG: hypothetical protein N2170_00835, partial [Bacteroidia bacterium]|nr:hypothetical protein [Bacteroidia bacterium]